MAPGHLAGRSSLHFEGFVVGLICLLWQCAEYLPVPWILVHRAEDSMQHQLNVSMSNELCRCCLQQHDLTYHQKSSYSKERIRLDFCFLNYLLGSIFLFCRWSLWYAAWWKTLKMEMCVQLEHTNHCAVHTINGHWRWELQPPTHHRLFSFLCLLMKQLLR